MESLKQSLPLEGAMLSLKMSVSQESRGENRERNVAAIRSRVQTSLAQEELRNLHKAVVGAAEDGLGLLQGIDLACARLLADVEVLEEEIARAVELGHVLVESHELLRRGLLRTLRRLEITFQLSLLAVLLRDRLRVRRALLRAVAHELLIVLLGLLLIHLSSLHILLQVILQLVNQRGRTTRVLLRVRVNRFRRRRRRITELRSDLGEHGHPSATDASARNRGFLRVPRVGAARVHVDALLLRKLAAFRGLVQSRIVELVEAVLGNLQQLQSGVVLGRRLDELLVLVLALLGRLRDSLVEFLDALLQRGNLGGHRLDRLLGLPDLGRQTLDQPRGILRLILGRVEFLLAPLLLCVVVLLLHAELHDHLIDQLDHLRKASLLALESHRDKAELRLLRILLQLLHQGEGFLANVPGAAGHLQQGRGRERLLEEVQRVVVVQDLDRLCDRDQLHGPHLDALVVLGRFGGAGLLQLHQEHFIRAKLLLRILEVVLQVDDLNGNLTSTLGLRLNRLRGSSDLLLLRRNQALELRNRFVLHLGDVGKRCLHVLLELLEDAEDLSRSRRIARVRREEGRERLPVVPRERHRVNGDLAQDLGVGTLQKASRHTLGNRVNGAFECGDVRTELP